MPWPKASQYKRFNVGQYMKERRLGWIENEKKAKKSQATAKKLKRLDEKVSKTVKYFINLLSENYIKNLGIDML